MAIGTYSTIQERVGNISKLSSERQSNTNL